MKTIFLLVSATLILVSCQSKNKITDVTTSTKEATSDEYKCKISGMAFKWQLSYCSWVTNIKDHASAKFQKCLERDNSKVKDLTECKKRRFFKKKYCNHQISLDYIKEGILTCMENKEYESKWLKKH